MIIGGRVFNLEDVLEFFWLFVWELWFLVLELNYFFVFEKNF